MLNKMFFKFQEFLRVRLKDQKPPWGKTDT